MLLSIAHDEAGKFAKRELRGRGLPWSVLLARIACMDGVEGSPDDPRHHHGKLPEAALGRVLYKTNDGGRERAWWATTITEMPRASRSLLGLSSHESLPPLACGSQILVRMEMKEPS